MNKQHRDRKAAAIATELNCETQKVLGWFRNQRTAVGKLYKKKSGQAAAPLTKRQQWQERSFGFLLEAIEPRTYSRDTASVRSGRSDEDEDRQSSASAVPTTSADKGERAGTSSRLPKKSRNLEEAMLSFFAARRDIAPVADLAFDATDERQAFATWFTSRLHRIPDNRWDAFHFEVIDVVRRFGETDPQLSGTLPPPQQWPPAPSGQPQQWSAAPSSGQGHQWPAAASSSQPQQWPAVASSSQSQQWPATAPSSSGQPLPQPPAVNTPLPQQWSVPQQQQTSQPQPSPQAAQWSWLGLATRCHSTPPSFPDIPSVSIINIKKEESSSES
ncbi:hypothetical protein OJAV_G00170040, partial [Oryzias javanicus]